MNGLEIDKIEEALSVRFSQHHREIFLFEDFADTYPEIEFDDRKSIIENNLKCREEGLFGEDFLLNFP